MKIHFIAVGGAIMHSMAIALKRKGYQVTGSDDAIADPARTNLEKEGLLPDAIGFFPDRITSDVQAVILGMHARSDNPELLRAQELGIPIYSFPQYVYEIARNKTRIVIAGSHGKTTITSMVMHVLHNAGIEIDYIVGAKVKGFDTGVRLSETAPIMVIEGDEYLASPIHRESKFMFYKPHIALISGIAWDHINVFPVYEDYVAQFSRFAGTVAAGGTLTFFQQDEELKRITEHYRGKANLVPYDAPQYEVRDGVTYVGAHALSVFGRHNMQNIGGALQVCLAAGISAEKFWDLIADFEGAANRLQLLGKNSHTAVYKDFAHSPSKLRATVAAMKEQFPNRRLTAVMELHTFSSLTPDFLSEYKDAMQDADEAIVFMDDDAIQLKKMAPISDGLIKETFNREDLLIVREARQLQQLLERMPWPHANLLLMSSGRFAGMNVQELADKIVL
ncbi:MAG: Mur ligase family protein [Chitinophagales bacterium]